MGEDEGEGEIPLPLTPSHQGRETYKGFYGGHTKIIDDFFNKES